MMTFYSVIVAVFVLATTLTCGMENSGCPESKKLYPGDCRLFYKCVPLLDSAQAYVWVPSRCTAGLVFHPTLKKCVLPDKKWNCPQDDQSIFELPFYEDLEEEETDEEDIKISNAAVTLMDDNFEITTATTIKADLQETPTPTYAPPKLLHSMEQDEVPLSAVDNTSADQIGNQMYRLTQLIDSLKASSKSKEKVTPVVYSALPQKSPYRINPTRTSIFPYKSSNSLAHEVNLLPTQLNKITAQLVMQTPLPNKQPTNPNSPMIDDLNYSKESLSPGPLSNYANTEHLVSALFHKYLTNNNFMNKGEYVKRDSIFIPTTSRKPELASKQTDNSIIRINNEHRLTTPRSHVPHATNTNVFYSKSCLNGVRLPNPNDCTRYFLCNSSTAAMQSYACPPNTAFNKLKRICDVEEYNRCTKGLEEFPENKEILHQEVPCDTQMCGGLQYFGDWKDIPFNCPGVLQFCQKRRACLPRSMCY